MSYCQNVLYNVQMTSQLPTCPVCGQPPADQRDEGRRQKETLVAQDSHTPKEHTLQSLHMSPENENVSFPVRVAIDTDVASISP